MTEHKFVNGINKERFDDTLKAIKDNPELAKFKLRAHNKWVNGTHCETKISDFYGTRQESKHKQEFVMHADEPEVLLGEDHGPNATEAALYALASCLNTTLICHAAAMGVNIDELELELEGELDLYGFLGLSQEVRNGYQNVNVKCRIKAEVSDEKLKELCELAQKRSPVFDIFTHEVPVKVQMERIQPAPAV